MRAFSQILSYLFHPILLPFYAVMYCMVANPYRFGGLESLKGQMLLLYVLGYTILIPVVILFFMRKMNFFSSIHMKDRAERLLPYMMMIFFFFFAYLAIGKTDYDPTFSEILLGASLIVMAAYIINVLFFKISAHALGVGALVAIVMYSMSFSIYQVAPFLAIAILIAGLVGTARLQLDAHEPRDIYWGYLLGYFIQLFVFMF